MGEITFCAMSDKQSSRNQKKRCYVPNCHKTSVKNESVIFHKFPKDPERRIQWQSLLKIRDITCSSNVCSNHFCRFDYFPSVPGRTAKKHLKKNALPSQNLPPECSELGSAQRTRKRRAKSIVQASKPRKILDVTSIPQAIKSKKMHRSSSAKRKKRPNNELVTASVDSTKHNIKGINGRKWCDICEQSYTVNYFPRHVKKHAGANVLSCGKRLLSVDQRNKHLATAHSKKRLYPCSYCPQFFTKQECLIKHEKYHSGTYSYQCKICSARFRTQDRFSMHLRKCHKLAPENPFEPSSETISRQKNVAKHCSFQLLNSKKKRHRCSYSDKNLVDLAVLLHLINESVL